MGEHLTVELLQGVACLCVALGAFPDGLYLGVVLQGVAFLGVVLQGVAFLGVAFLGVAFQDESYQGVLMLDVD